MSFSSRPVSSPGRTENPPLLMRFLRTNAGSRSRHRSRSRSRSKRRPIFFRRKNATETQEPSSPKVTCMGQVRINRSKKPKPGTNRVNGGHLHGGGATESRRQRRRCGWVKNAFSCHPFSGGKLKPTCFTPAWRKWKSFTNVSFSRKSEKRSSSSRSEPIFSRSTVEPEETEEIRKKERKQDQEEEESDSDKSFPATPPRNAFLLTRCRSAPYRSPSLGDNFLEEETKESHFQRHGNDVIASPEDVSVSSHVTEEVKRCVLGSPRRQCMVLTRCKSEPARLGEKLVSENRRLGYT
ncbi:hypothetical protein Bca101_041692 [Brassica carinata]